MKKLFFTLSIVIAVSLVVSIVKAQTDDGIQLRKVIEKIPTVGKTPPDFIPAGWKIHSETIAHGDLNGDGLPDYALDITPSEDADNPNSFYDAVLVLFAQRDGGLRRIGLNDALTDNSFGSKQEVSIEKGVLVTSNNYGNNSATDVTFKFRFDKAAGALLLIGFDYETYARSGNENGYATSYNFLTGVKEKVINYVDRRPNAQGVYDKQSRKRIPIGRLKIPFEKSKLNLADDGSDVKPF